MQYLTTLFNDLIILTKTNQLFAGFLGMWGVTVSTYLLRELPGKIYNLIVSQYTISLIINSQDAEFSHFVTWYEKKGFSKKSRTLSMNGRHQKDEDGYKFSAGYGRHCFFYKGRGFKLVRTKNESDRHNGLQETLTLTTFGRSQMPIRKLLEDVQKKILDNDLVSISKWAGDYWEFVCKQNSRSIDNLILADDVKKQLEDFLDNFRINKDWYRKHQIPYRTGICLYGPPGTGKSSLVNYIAGKEKKDIMILNLSDLNDKGVEAALEGVSKDSIVLIEDIDTFIPTLSRTLVGSEKVGTKKLTLSGVLNAIDGVLDSDGRILIITTNKKDVLDPALLRPGRIDLQLNLDYLQKETIKKAFTKFYPDFKMNELETNVKLTPAEFQNLVLKNRENPNEVLKELYLMELQ